MSSKMLVDATQPEETRVAIVSSDNNRLEDFDFESKVIKQIKGNIYLAKVTRVEPSLQAAFLEYGGNRQGFLPFNEIHLDYFRIPIADREKLLEQENEILSEDNDNDNIETEETPDEPNQEIAEEIIENNDEGNEEGHDGEGNTETTVDEKPSKKKKTAKLAHNEEGDLIDEEIDAHRPKFRISHRNYKIQEVIKPRQIMLIQASKEERGNKGAAITTYISLPGRYCVLMPNSPRGGGVSRKINNPKDRQKMKKILDELNVPDGMSVILRTAGIAKNKTEIKRDLNYLLRLWDNIREETLQSNAPDMIYEEADLIKRSIRDLYHSDVEEVQVAGNEGYRRAKDFMKMLMPSHAKKVKEYKEKTPIFQSYTVEKQIDEVFKTTAELKSGGYLVINPTEALVSIDVNSGRSTKERHIEETALRTNIEAAEEVARQLRLRDLGGLVVIDFIDMETYKHNRQVEKKMRECLMKDRARTQVGRISNFGLMELSRQRLRPSLFETNFEICSACDGTGRTRTVESAALMVLRTIETDCMKNNKTPIAVTIHPEVALYIFNHKRSVLTDLEETYGNTITITVDDALPTGNIGLPGGAEDKASGEKDSRHKRKDNADTSDEKGRRNKKRGKRGGRRRQNTNNRHKKTNKSDKEPVSKETDSVTTSETTTNKQKKPATKRGRPAKKTKTKKSEDKETGTPSAKSTSDKKAEKTSSKREVSDDANENTQSSKKGWWKRLRENS